MPGKRKKIHLIFFILIILIVAAVVGARFIPFHKIFKLPGTTEKEFVNRQSINSEAPHALYFDFEVDPKTGNYWTLYKGIAHSGQYSTKAFGKNSFSFSVERTAGDIGLDNLGAVSMSAWIYIFPGKNDPMGNFVFTASNDNVNVVWKGITVSGSDVPRGKWFKISGMFNLSDVTFKPGYKLNVFFWNNSSTDILIDDYYIVFGGEKPRKGDSTLVDLTRKPFKPEFNFPPFPFHWFGREEIGNGNSSFLVNSGKLKEGDISPYDRIFSGHFISGPGETEDLLVVKKSGDAEIFKFCRDDKAFRKIIIRIPPEVQPLFRSAGILTGCFSGTGNSQLLLSDPSGILAGEFEKVKDPCSGEVTEVKLKIFLKESINPFSGVAGHLIAADLDGNKITDILSIAGDGSWKVFRLDKMGKEHFTVLASGNSDVLKIWNPGQNDFTITPGRFLQKYPQDLLLAVSRNKTKPGYSWTILRFDQASRTFQSCFHEKQNMLGKTIGLDTLKPGDQFLAGAFDNSGKIKVFRYNRDWRYDLKEILFNDSTFQVLANMDFTGYENDFNPKYFEILRLVPAMLVRPDLTSLLVIGKNCKKWDPKEKQCEEFVDLPALPGTIQIYSLAKPEK